uniref:adhesion G protein-coupled receptor B3-like n=1 Tax=Myxine glutinosa TaxID=7769 RepID=UPI00358E67E6
MPEARRAALLLLAHCCCCCFASLAPEPMASACRRSTRDVSGGAFSLRVRSMEDSCGWVVVNPDPRTSTVCARISKGAHVCSRYRLLVCDLETFPAKSGEPQTDMCAEPASTVTLASQARYLHLRLKWRNVTGESTPPVLLEYIILSDAHSGCRALRAWARRCTHFPGMIQMPRSCDPEGTGDKGSGLPSACRLNYTGGPVRPPRSHECHNSSESNGLPTWRSWSSCCPCLSQCLLGRKELLPSCSFQCGGHVACLGLSRNWRHCGSSSCSDRSGQVGNVPHKLSVRSIPAGFSEELNYRSTWPLNSQTGDWSTDTWSQWSSCSVSCGHGSQLRTRSCHSSTHGQHCGGPLRESRSCNSTQPCPVHGVWEEWSPWSLCSTTCGRGFRDRSRSCAHPAHGGQPCDGYDRQTRSCNIALCPIDGHWSKWTSWSLCSVTCGNGTRQRTRDCNGPAFGGSDCRGPWAEEQPCSNAACTEFTEAIRRCKDQNCPALHGFCKEETLQGLTWKKTSVGKSAIHRCPSNATGIITRPCSLDSSATPYWQKPSFARCISHNYRRLVQSVRIPIQLSTTILVLHGHPVCRHSLVDNKYPTVYFLKIYKMFKWEETEKDDPNRVLGHFVRFVRPRKNKRIARNWLRQQKQGSEEMFHNFVKNLRIILMDCEYADPEDILIDANAAGIHEPKMQERLLNQAATTMAICPYDSNRDDGVRFRESTYAIQPDLTIKQLSYSRVTSNSDDGVRSRESTYAIQPDLTIKQLSYSRVTSNSDDGVRSRESTYAIQPDLTIKQLSSSRVISNRDDGVRFHESTYAIQPDLMIKQFSYSRVISNRDDGVRSRESTYAIQPDLTIKQLSYSRVTSNSDDGVRSRESTYAIQPDLTIKQLSYSRVISNRDYGVRSHESTYAIQPDLTLKQFSYSHVISNRDDGVRSHESTYAIQPDLMIKQLSYSRVISNRDDGVRSRESTYAIHPDLMIKQLSYSCVISNRDDGVRSRESTYAIQPDLTIKQFSYSRVISNRDDGVRSRESTYAIQPDLTIKQLSSSRVISNRDDGVRSRESTYAIQPDLTIKQLSYSRVISNRDDGVRSRESTYAIQPDLMIKQFSYSRVISNRDDGVRSRESTYAIQPDLTIKQFSYSRVISNRDDGVRSRESTYATQPDLTIKQLSYSRVISNRDDGVRSRESTYAIQPALTIKQFSYSRVIGQPHVVRLRDISATQNKWSEDATHVACVKIVRQTIKGRKTVNVDEISGIIKELLDLSSQKKSYSGDLLVSMEVLKNITQTIQQTAYTPSSEDIQNYVQVLSNLLWIENKGKWEEAQQLYLASLDFVKIVEDFIQIISTTVKAVHTSYLITENIVISIRKLFVMEETRDMTFPTKARRGMVSWVRNSEDKVFMSKETLSKLTTGMQESAVVGNVLYKNLGSILPTPPNGSTVNSRIVSVTINPPPKSLVPPLEIMFSHLHNVSSTSYCVLWDGPKLGDGGWSQDGCTAAFSDASHTRCACERASTYAIFTTLSNRKDMDRKGISSLSLAAGCVVSSLALTFLIIAYCIFWRAIKSDRSVILINFCVSIISSNILILIGQTQVHNKVTCSLIAGLLHFFFLASFCWVLTEAWQSYMAVIGRLRSKIIRKRFLCLGWGLPALVVAISIGFTKTKGYGTANYCWLSLEGGLLYAFVGPAAMVVLVNMIIGILVFNKLVSKEGIPDKRLKHRAGASLWSSCVVLPLLALTWMSAVLAITDKRSGLFQILFAIFDSLQGIVIVIVHCVLRKEVQDALKCRLRSSHDQVNGDSSASFPNGHVQIMSDFEKDVDLACRSVLRKDINTCRQTACKTTASTTLSCLADEAFDKKDFSEVVGSPTRGIIPAGFMPDVQLLGPPNYMAPLGGSASIALVEGPWGELEPSVPKATGLFAGNELQIASDLGFTTGQRRALESDYVLLPRGTAASAAQFKASPQDLAAQGILLGPIMEPSFEPGLAISTLAPVTSSAEPFARTSLDHPFDLHSIFQGFLGKASSTERKETTLAALRSETSSNVSISSLERRKPRYSELDFEKIMRTRKRHQEMFQELSQKFQSVGKSDESPRKELVDMQSPSNVTWENMHRSSPQPYLEPHSQTELPGIEWENPSSSIPLSGNDSDIQTEV